MRKPELWPLDADEHERFRLGLERSFPVWHQGERQRRVLDRVCQAVVLVCAGVLVGLALWGAP